MNENDKRIKALMFKVEEEKKKLGKKPRVSLNTNGIFKFDDRDHFNLNTVSQTSVLVEALGVLLEKESRSVEAAKRLGVENFEFTWSGFSLSDWEHDFKLRVSVLQWQEGQKKLKSLEKKLDTLISEDAKTQMALDDIEELLK